RIRDDFKRPSVFRELKLLAGVGVAFPQNCGTFAEHRSTTCGLSLSAYGRPPRINAIRHPDARARVFRMLFRPPRPAVLLIFYQNFYENSRSSDEETFLVYRFAENFQANFSMARI
ncbi:hypothetical protein X777_05433, partial [Ooceraea biroi]